MDRCGKDRKIVVSAEVYRFHCTDGRHAFFDLRGRKLRYVELVWTQAERVAREIVAARGGMRDWSGWIVDVHDAKGRRTMLLAFTDVRGLRSTA